MKPMFARSDERHKRNVDAEVIEFFCAGWGGLFPADFPAVFPALKSGGVMQGKKLTGLSERKITKLLRRGLGLHRVTERLNPSMYAVRSVAVKRGFRRKDGNGYAHPDADEKAFLAALPRRDDYAWRLARKYKSALSKPIDLRTKSQKRGSFAQA